MPSRTTMEMGFSLPPLLRQQVRQLDELTERGSRDEETVDRIRIAARSLHVGFVAVLANFEDCRVTVLPTVAAAERETARALRQARDVLPEHSRERQSVQSILDDVQTYMREHFHSGEVSQAS